MLNIGEPVYRTCVLTWSEDQKIAVTSSRIVYVCHLKSALHTRDTSSKTEPLTEVTVVTLPDCLDPIDVGITLTESKDGIEPPIMKRYCSERHGAAYCSERQGAASERFRISQWTPCGCSLHGGCLLACLTNGGHVILFAPPPAFGYQWRKIKVVSDALRDYWKSCCYGNSQSQSDNDLYDNDFYESDRRRELLGITSFLCLPGVMRSQEHSTVVMVITTETNHVIFIRCVFDLLQGDITCTVDHVIQLPANGRGCKLACMQHQDDIFLSVGCFNGDVYLLIMGGAAKSFAYTDSQPHRITNSNDNISVNEMIWEKISKPSAEHCTLVIAKRQIIVVVRVPLMGGAIAGQGVVQGHVFPSTGLASLPGGRFVSCSRDRNVLQFTSPEHLPDPVDTMVTNIKTTPIDIQLTGEPIGIATSHNGLFIAVAEMVIASKPFLHAQCKICFTKLTDRPCELIGHFENMVAMETPLYLCWDVFELLRQLLHANTPININSLLPPEISNGLASGNKYCLQLAKMILMTAGSCDLDSITINNLDMEKLNCRSTRNHISECLTHWLSEQDIHNNNRDIANNMLGWLTAFGSTADETLRKDVQAKLESMSHTMKSQLCPVCGDTLQWTTYHTMECSNQHKWSCCYITCTVLGRYNGRSCTQCGACTTKGLRELKLLPQRASHICLRCGGLLQIL